MANAPSSIHSRVSPLEAERPASEDFRRGRARRVRRLLLVVPSILLLAHLFLYGTWIEFHPSLRPVARTTLLILVPVAALSFVAASLLAWRSFHWTVRIFYTITAVWVGLVNGCLFAACFCWIALGPEKLAGLRLPYPLIADAFFAAALLVGLCGVVNAAVIRVNRVTVGLPNLPGEWCGRVAALVSDMHLGQIRNLGFMRRVVARLNQLRPDIVFIAGDLYDGTAIDAPAAAQPWSALSAPLGAFFVTGNHEEFTHRAKFLDAIAAAGVRVVNNEKIDVQGLQIVGVHFREAANPGHFRAILRNAAISPERASILLVHAPNRLAIAEEAGISLQMSGHTHGGQFPPGTWIVSRIYGPFVHGLHRFGNLLVYTNWGIGTWGPPLRLGTNPEITLFTFEQR
jgi:uncharacterized protein